MGLRDLAAAVQDLVDGVNASVNAVVGALQGGTSTFRDLHGVRASLTGYRADLAGIRGTLDATDVADFNLSGRADTFLRALRWERELRHRLVRLGSQILSAETAAAALEAGVARHVHLVVSGDTLQRLAARYLGDWQAWPRILEANPDLSPGPLTSGTVLVIPAKR